MAQLIHGLRTQTVAANLQAVRERLAAAAARAGRSPAEVEVLAAIKYVPRDELPVLAQAGITLVGENRAQELAAKQDAHRELFEWHFIGQLQSRKVAQVAARASVIHSLSSRSALAQLRRRADDAPGLQVLLQVELAGDGAKAGIPPADVPLFVERCPVPVTGLMTMPPLARSPEDSRRWFAALRELAAEHGLARLSMGTSQDWEVAVEEGATIVRLGSALYV